MTTAVIIEDELHAYNRLKKIIDENYDSEIKIVGNASRVKPAIDLIEKQQPNLIFLDIQLIDGTGFDVLDYFKNNDNFDVIFTTAFLDYKEKAMDYFAFYYLTKPIVKDKLITIIDKFQTKKSGFNLEKYLAFKKQLDNQHKTITINANNQYIIIDLNDLIYCEADGNYTNFYTTDSKIYLTSTNLKRVEELLDKTMFYRIHRSLLININHVKSYNNDGEILLANNKTVYVSSRKRKSFFTILKLNSYTLD